MHLACQVVDRHVDRRLSWPATGYTDTRHGLHAVVDASDVKGILSDEDAAEPPKPVQHTADPMAQIVR